MSSSIAFFKILSSSLFVGSLFFTLLRKKIFQFYFNITRFLVSVQNISFKKPTFNGAKARGDVGEYEVEMGGPAEGIS